MIAPRRILGLICGLCAVILVVGCSGNSSAPAEGNRPQSLFSADLAERLDRHDAQTGDVQASLIWNNYNDLDLHIIDPNDERIYFAHKRARSGGELDVDMNARGRESNEPVENIYFPQGGAPAGRYRVYVHYYAKHDSDNLTPFRCEVLVKDEVHKFSGEMSKGDPIRLIYEFTLEGKQEKPIPLLFSPRR